MRTTITYTILIILIAVGFAGCDWFGSTEPNNGNLKLVWQSKLYTTGPVSGRFPNVIYDNRIFVTMAQIAEYETKIVGLDIETGQQLWEWSDNYVEKEAGDFRSVAQYGKNIVFTLGGKHYCINAETGKTVWRNRVDNASSSSIVQLGNKYFYSGGYYNSNPYQAAIFMGNIET